MSRDARGEIRMYRDPVTARAYGHLVAAARRARRTRRPGLLVRIAVWRLRRIDPANPALS